MDKLIFRKAKESDLPFIFDGIVESEKSSSDIFSYSEIFSVSELEFRNVLFKIFQEEIPNQPWCLSTWFIGEIEGYPVSCLSVWVEEGSFQSSDFLKSQLLNHFLSKKWLCAQENLNEISKISISRQVGTLQLEHIYTLKKFQGKGIMKRFLLSIFEKNKDISFEIQLLASNFNALSLYEKLGFKLREKKCNSALMNKKLLPSDCKISLIKKV